VNNEAYSLSRLKDIVIPEPPPLWPFAPGVWALVALVTLLFFLGAYLKWKSWKRDAYRRAGTVLLSDARSVHEVSIILKRVALAAYPREAVASLYGEDWVAFLNSTYPASEVPTIATESNAPASGDLVEFAANWIRRHKASNPHKVSG
jgi:hypothetical protein